MVSRAIAASRRFVANYFRASPARPRRQNRVVIGPPRSFFTFHLLEHFFAWPTKRGALAGLSVSVGFGLISESS